MIRIATLDDLAACCAIDHSLLGHGGRASYLSERQAEGQLFVQTIGDSVKGFACCDQNLFFNRRFLSLLVVATPVQRQGHARALLRHTMNLAPEPLWTSTNRSNSAMRALLAKEQFIPCGAIEGLDEGDPELIFRAPPAKPANL